MDGGGFVALLFYSDGSATIGTNGKMPDGRNTKILWLTKERQAGSVTLSGVLADGEARVTKVLEGGYDFPSIIDLPKAGCWRLSLNGQQGSLGSIDVEAKAS
jgi:hypothetical protein